MATITSDWQRVSALASLLRLRPFDASSELGRSRERYRRAALTAITSVLAKGISSAALLVSVPLSLGYLGTERYALWMTVSSAVAMLTFTDLGIGNGLVNTVSECDGKADSDSAAIFISSGFFMLLGMAAAVLALFWLLSPFAAWHRLFNVSGAAAMREAAPAMMALVVCFALALPLGIVQRTQLGYQDGYVSHLWSAGGSVMGLLALLAALWLHAGLPWLIVAVTGVPCIATLANGLLFFGRQHPELRPRFSRIRQAAMLRLLKLGGCFVVLQLAAAVAFSSDNLVIAHLLGPEAVAEYSVAFRGFAIIAGLVALATAPLWPAYREALSRGDVLWSRRTLLRSALLTAVAAAVPAGALVIMGRWLIPMWIGTAVMSPLLLLAGLGVWTVLGTVGGAVAMFLNGAELMRFQVKTAIAMALVNLLLTVVLTHAIGVAGTIWGRIFSYSFVTMIPTLLFVRKALDNLALRRTALS